MLSRREFLARFGGIAAASVAVYALPGVLAGRGWWSPAHAEDTSVVLDTYNGLAAMLWPGDDLYSVAQGESNDQPGAVAANAGYHLMVTLDGLVPGVPLSAVVSGAVNAVALQVNPVAAGGSFPSPFARLPFADKAAVWQTLEQDVRRVTVHDPSDSLGVLHFVVGVLPAFVVFFAFSEADVYDPKGRRVTRRPVGWDHCGYLTGRNEPVEGWDEFGGYYQGRMEVDG